MQRQNQSRGYSIVSIKPSFVAPAGIYSAKYKAIDQIPAGAKIGIPNDPANTARALVLLAKAGLIRLKDGVSVQADLADVAEKSERTEHHADRRGATARAFWSTSGAGVVTLNKGVLAGLRSEVGACSRRQDLGMGDCLVGACRTRKMIPPSNVSFRFLNPNKC